VLAHELAHVRRGDAWLSIVPFLAQTLFWFFPPAAWACREFDLAREGACDAAARRATGIAPDDYGALLMELSVRRPGGGAPVGALGAGATYHALNRRLTMLNVPLAPRRRAGALCVFLLAASAGCVVIPWRVVVAAAAEAQEGSVTRGGWVQTFRNDDFGGNHMRTRIMIRPDGWVMGQTHIFTEQAFRGWAGGVRVAVTNERGRTRRTPIFSRGIDGVYIPSAVGSERVYPFSVRVPDYRAGGRQRVTIEHVRVHSDAFEKGFARVNKTVLGNL